MKKTNSSLKRKKSPDDSRALDASRVSASAYARKSASNLVDMEDVEQAKSIHGAKFPMTNSKEILNLDLELKCDDKKQTEAQRLKNIQTLVDQLRVVCNAPTEDQI